MLRFHSGSTLPFLPALFLICLNGPGSPACAQVAAVTGTVVDAVTGAPVEFANVFLAQTTSGTSTDSTGVFMLRNIPPGTYELVVSRVGYLRASQSIDLTTRSMTRIRITLQPRNLESEEVEVVGMEPGEWNTLYAMFVTAFIGRSDNASSCTILNPHHLDLRFDYTRRLLTARCDTALLIENRALGYQLAAELDMFEWDVGQDIGSYVVYPRFSGLRSPTADDSVAWAARRERTYRGSLKHFLQSMIAGAPDEEMFALYAGSLNALTNGDGEEASLTEVVMAPDSILGGYRLAFSGWLRVDYCGRIPKERNYILLRTPYARVDRYGNLITPLSIHVAGVWARCRIADLLPLY